MISLIVVLITLTIVVIFSVQNTGPVDAPFLSRYFEASLAMVIALSFLGGMIVCYDRSLVFWLELGEKELCPLELVRSIHPGSFAVLPLRKGDW